MQRIPENIETIAHSLTPEQLAAEMQTDLTRGLTEKQASERIREIGPNEIPEDRPRGVWRILFGQIADPVILILLGAALLAYLFEDSWQGTAILVVLVISVAIGFFMEIKAYRTLESLRRMGQSRTRVVRSGKLRTIGVTQLVPGDLVVLAPGDVVPADLRLIYSEQLSAKESALTGESVPGWKQSETPPTDTSLSERTNMLFKGTTVMTGSGKAITVATGPRTELGKIQTLGIASRSPHTPLEKKLKALTIRLIWLTGALTVLIFLSGLLRGADWIQMLETALALAVAAIPEGLPIVATIALARGMFRLSRRQVVVKHLQAIQTLGATDIILTDKTGTLTEDSLEVQSLRYGKEQKPIEVGADIIRTSIPKPGSDREFDLLMRNAVLCNNEKAGELSGGGDSLELALLNFARAAGYDIEQTRQWFPEVGELPFDPQRKLMATLHRDREAFVVHVKGASEVILSRSSYIQNNGEVTPFDSKERWTEMIDDLAASGLRTLAFASKMCRERPGEAEMLTELTFLGVIGFMDPAREDIRPVIDVYRKAGIRVVMVTGDHPLTALRISREVGLIDPSDGASCVFDGAESSTTQVLEKARVFARVLPSEKLDLVKGYQDEGHIVGMIGDGINDVPALKKADIGIAMGIRGTEAAREVSDVILRDDSFGSIELAIRQGRVVFRNIRQFVLYLLSCNLAEILAVAVAALGNLPAPLLPLQILFLNLVTDVFPALALGLGKGPPDIMERPPANPKDPILRKADWSRILLYGAAIGASVLGVVLYGTYWLDLSASLINNLAFYTLMGAQLLHVFNHADSNSSIFRNEITSNTYIWGAILISVGIMVTAYMIPQVAEVLNLEHISPGLLLVAIGFSFGSVLLVQGMKAILTRFGYAPES